MAITGKIPSGFQLTDILWSASQHVTLSSVHAFTRPDKPTGRQSERVQKENNQLMWVGRGLENIWRQKEDNHLIVVVALWNNKMVAVVETVTKTRIVSSR